MGRDGGDDRQPVQAAAMERIDIPHGEGVAAIIAAISEVRFVGGCVRDTLAGQLPHDIDLATPLSPETVVAKLEAASLKAIPTGIAHGTITAVAQGQTVEITTLRRDEETDGRRATIAFTSDWQEDAARRDFTINALFADPHSGELFDYFGGADDLRAGIVRFIGAPLQRIAEDHLRILRFFRFSARYAKSAIHAESLAACAERANDLMALSRERIAMELLALLALPDPSATTALMIEHGIFNAVIPEITDARQLARLVEREREHLIAANPLRRLAALLPVGTADDVGARLKLSKAQRKRLINAEMRSPGDAMRPEALAYQLGLDSAMDRLLLGDGPVTLDCAWSRPGFPLSGGAIIKRGIAAGPEVARILQAVERQWVEEGFPEPARIDAILTEHLQV